MCQTLSSVIRPIQTVLNVIYHLFVCVYEHPKNTKNNCLFAFLGYHSVYTQCVRECRCVFYENFTWPLKSSRLFIVAIAQLIVCLFIKFVQSNRNGLFNGLIFCYCFIRLDCKIAENKNDFRLQGKSINIKSSDGQCNKLLFCILNFK